MGSNLELVKYQNFWFLTTPLKNILHYQAHFKARDSDIILASLPKTGTTWLKSLLFTIVNRTNPDHQPLINKSPLLNNLGVYGGNPLLPSPQQLHDEPPSTLRLLHSHLPYASLPESIKSSSSCKIVYIARNPLDTFVSQWHWHANLLKNRVGDHDELEPPSIEDFFESFCQGKFPYGPYFNHVIEFWKQSLEQPNKILFLKYEDLKSDQVVLQLKKLAEFVGFPFSSQEENEGLIKDIIKLCSINNLKDLEVNKNGFMNKFVKKKDFFRKGEVGDWINYFTPTMVERINNLMEEQLKGTDLSFDSSFIPG
ncbi:Cytosolic sulfotransferase 1 [Bienertia sinuspersici]